MSHQNDVRGEQRQRLVCNGPAQQQLRPEGKSKGEGISSQRMISHLNSDYDLEEDVCISSTYNIPSLCYL